MNQTRSLKTPRIDLTDCAEIDEDFSVIQCVLQDERRWAAQVLAFSGYCQKTCKWVSFLNFVTPSRIIPLNPDKFIALGPIGLTERLVYQLQRTDSQKTRVIPLAYIDTASKIGSTIFLLLLFLFPALFSPLLWIKIQRRNLIVSKILLAGFCAYLEDFLHQRA